MANTIPNLTDMTSEELMAFWKRYARPSRKDAEALIGDRRRGFTTLCGSLAGYASNLATAKTCRAKGDVRAAEVSEGIAGSIYARLPAAPRW